MYLLDTNIWLELLLDQERAERDDATLITFDKDFDSTLRGRRMPAEVLASLKTLSQKESDESTTSSS